MVKSLPAVQETQVQSLGWEDPPGKIMATHSTILAWRIPWTEDPGGLQSMGSHRVEHDWVTHTHTSFKIPWKSLQLRGLLLSHSVVSDSLQPHGLQHASLLCPSPSSGVYSNSCPSSQCCHSTISSSAFPSPPAFNLSQSWGLFQWVSSLHQVAKVLAFQLQHQSFQWIFRVDFH